MTKASFTAKEIVSNMKPKKARGEYACDWCESSIARNSEYYRFDVPRCYLHACEQECMIKLLESRGLV
jgi:hypothetical protein